MEESGQGASRSGKASPKDVFLHLLSILALYGSSGSFLALLFQYVNLAFPDLRRDDFYYNEAIYHSIRLAISTLIVLFPAYIATSWYLGKAYLSNPEKRNLRIRKWLLYFTLFVAALIVLGDFVTLIYNFLEGGLTASFVLKVIAVFFVAGSVFFYYLWDLRKYKTE